MPQNYVQTIRASLPLAKTIANHNYNSYIYNQCMPQYTQQCMPQYTQQCMPQYMPACTTQCITQSSCSCQKQKKCTCDQQHNIDIKLEELQKAYDTDMNYRNKDIKLLEQQIMGYHHRQQNLLARIQQLNIIIFNKNTVPPPPVPIKQGQKNLEILIKIIKQKQLQIQKSLKQYNLVQQSNKKLKQQIEKYKKQITKYQEQSANLHLYIKQQEKRFEKQCNKLDKVYEQIHYYKQKITKKKIKIEKIKQINITQQQSIKQLSVKLRSLEQELINNRYNNETLYQYKNTLLVREDQINQLHHQIIRLNQQKSTLILNLEDISLRNVQQQPVPVKVIHVPIPTSIPSPPPQRIIQTHYDHLCPHIGQKTQLLLKIDQLHRIISSLHEQIRIQRINKNKLYEVKIQKVMDRAEQFELLQQELQRTKRINIKIQGELKEVFRELSEKNQIILELESKLQRYSVRLRQLQIKLSEKQKSFSWIIEDQIQKDMLANHGGKTYKIQPIVQKIPIVTHLNSHMQNSQYVAREQAIAYSPSHSPRRLSPKKHIHQNANVTLKPHKIINEIIEQRQ